LIRDAGAWKQIDPDGRVLMELDPSYATVSSFNGKNGAAARDDGRVALIDASGTPLTGFEYGTIRRYPLNDTLFLVSPDPPAGYAGYTGFPENWMVWGLISETGALVAKPQYYRLSFPGAPPYVQTESDTGLRAIAYKAISSPDPPVFLDEYGVEHSENAYSELESGGDWPRVVVEYKTIVPDQEPLLRSGRVLFPVRNLADALGYTTFWEAADKTVTVQDGERIIRMTAGETLATVNRFDDGDLSETIAMDVAPAAENGRTFVPVRFLAEAFDLDVEWEEDTRTIRIVTDRTHAERMPLPAD
jgi:hypothetical protein